MVGNLGRVSTFGLNDSNIGNIVQTQRQISDLSAQISSGKVARRYEGIADRSNRLVNIENELERTLQYKTNAADVERRLEGMESSLAAMIDMGTELKADLVLASNPGNAENMPLAELGRAFFEQAASFLNLEQDNRYVFGGTKTDRPPVASIEEVTAAFRRAQAEDGVGLDVANLAGKNEVVEDFDENSSVPLRALQIIDFFTNDEDAGTINSAYPLNTNVNYAGSQEESDFRANTKAGSFRDFYYQGNEFELSSKIEDNNDLEYGVKANRKGIEKALLAGWILADIGNPTPVDGPERTRVGSIPGVTGTNVDNFINGAAADFEISLNGVALPTDVTLAGQSLSDIADEINTLYNANGLEAEVVRSAIPFTAVASSAGAAFPNAATAIGGGGAVFQFRDQSGAQIIPDITVGGGDDLDTVAATVNANVAANAAGLTATVRTSGTGPDGAWLEFSFDDGRTFSVTDTVGTQFNGGGTLPTSEFNESLQVRDINGGTVELNAVDVATLGVPETTGNINTTLDTEDRVEVALKLLEDVLQGFGADTLTAVRSDVGTDLARIETVKERYNAFELFNEEVQVEIENTDIATAATQLSQSQLILESSFLAISSISRLSLANFLR